MVCNQRLSNPAFPPVDAQRIYDWGIADTNTTEGPLNREENWFCRNTLRWVSNELYKNTFSRGDYRELCQLIYYILSGKVRITFLFFVDLLLFSLLICNGQKLIVTRPLSYT